MPRPPVAKPSARPVRTVAFVSLGCPKNLVDSEKMLGLLAEEGLLPVSDPAAAEAIVVNTCGFLEAAKEESLREIRQAAALKAAGTCRRLVVAGCLVQRHRARMLEWCPQIDALIGVFNRDDIVAAVRGQRPDPADPRGDGAVYSSIAGNAAIARRTSAGQPGRAAPPAPGAVAPGPASVGYFESDAARLRLTPRHYAYLRISEGCNQHCSFCTIPSIRGKMRSKPVDAILAEARELIADGAFELNLIGQDTTSYGQDIGYGPGLAGMLAELDRAVAGRPGATGTAANPGAWLRLMYAYPSCFTDAMIAAVADLPGVVKYIDMPLQHIADPVLEAMRRNTSRKLIETLLARLRRRVPGIAIRTTFISGFPGETAAQHRELVRFVRDQRFEAMGVFPFSPEPGTPAGTRHRGGRGAVKSATVRARVEELMLAQQEVAFARNAELARAQTRLQVLIDQPAAAGDLRNRTSLEEPAVHAAGAAVAGDAAAEPAALAGRRLPARGKLYLGRTPAQAPQIDGVTYVCSRQKLAPGEVVPCRVTDFAGYDLIAQPLADLEKRLPLPVMH